MKSCILKIYLTDIGILHGLEDCRLHIYHHHLTLSNTRCSGRSHNQQPIVLVCLDLDWRWVNYAIDQGVILSINPDAHEIEGFDDMKYGVYMGRKGGLTKEKTFNAWGLESVEKYLMERKERILG